MEKGALKKWLLPLGVLAGLWLGVRYLLPVILPFGLGTLLALAAEPLVNMASGRWKWRRSAASAVGVSVTLLLLAVLAGLLGALVIRELGVIVGKLPEVGDRAVDSLQNMRGILLQTVQKAPSGMRAMLTRTVERSIPETGDLLDKVTHQAPKAMGTVLSRLPKGALGIFTGVLSAFMISARLPKLKASLAARVPAHWRSRYLPMLAHIRKGLFGWLLAQLKLMAITWGIVGLGLTLMGLELGFLWGGLIALVDAFPVLGTGTVLIPWALFCLLQGNVTRALGLALIYLAALTVRTVLEPRLVGKQLGLDPLVTLAAFYTGVTLWGFWGMVLAPVFAAVIAACKQQEI